MPALLHSARRAGIGLAEAVAAAGLDGAIGLVSAPDAFSMALVQGGSLVGPGGQLDLANVFEARWFSPLAEARWIRRGVTGEAVVLSEDPAIVDRLRGERLEDLSPVATVPQVYLLWGTTTGVGVGGESGWCEVEERRIGRLPVPFEAGVTRGRVALASVEYVCVAPPHGNAFVAEERLVELRWAAGVEGADEEGEN